MTACAKRKIEYGDFQTPDRLALAVCRRLRRLGIDPDCVIEPTCGLGAFVRAAARVFRSARSLYGFEIRGDYLERLGKRPSFPGYAGKVRLRQSDFFREDWSAILARMKGRVLILGNLPWVTNSAQGALGGVNLPGKSNFLGRPGFEAISGSANFDISEWMLTELLRTVGSRQCDLAVLVKTSVARKALARAASGKMPVQDAQIARIDARREFGATVDACLLVIRLAAEGTGTEYEYTVYDGLGGKRGLRVGYRGGMAVGDLRAFDRNRGLFGASPQKWRSGMKHDAAAVFEFSGRAGDLTNGLGEKAAIDKKYLYPLMKGSDVGRDGQWRGRRVLVTQRYVGEPTEPMRAESPGTWKYLCRHRRALAARRSAVYANRPPFSVFGVGDYAFRPWKIAICGLYKSLAFRLIGPVDGKPVFFDDTVYYVSFDTEGEAAAAFAAIGSEAARELYGSLVFWDEKRPVKASVLNLVDWSAAESRANGKNRPGRARAGGTTRSGL